MKDPDLVIEYFPDSDTLRLGAGVPAAEGETIAKWLMVEWGQDNEVTGVVLRNAAKVLSPHILRYIEGSSDGLEKKNAAHSAISSPSEDGLSVDSKS